MKKYLLGLLSVFPSLAFADVDFYAYGGYETVVNGFTYMRNVYDNSQYGLLVFTILSMSIFLSASLNTIKGLTGQSKASQMLSQIFFCCLGFAIYQGAIIPKTTVHVYDTVLNKYQPVNNVPLLIASLASGVNILERVGSSTFAAHSLSRTNHGAGATTQLLSEIMNRDPLKYTPYLAKSIEHYIDDCMPPALTSNVGNYATFSLDNLLHQTNNLITELEKLASTFQTTVYYDASNRAGQDVTCASAWTSIAGLLALPATFDDFYAEGCRAAGYEADVGTCKTRLSEVADFLMDSTAGFGSEIVAANQALAHNLYRNLAENPVAYMDDIVNLKNQSSGLSTLVAAGSWLPTIRYSTMMLIVGILPLITLMFFTPMLGIALKYTAGLLLFIAIWGLTDTAIHGITLGNIENQMAALQTTKFSVYTFMTAPNELQKAVATMGKMQSMGLILATILVGIFFKISGHAFANMGGKLQSDVDKIGGEVGHQTFDPSNRMSTIDSYAQASYKSQNLGSMGTEGYAAATSKPVYQQQQEDNKYLEGAGGTPTQAMQQEASWKAGERLGVTHKMQQISDKNEMELVDYSKLKASESTQNTAEDIHSTRDSREILSSQSGIKNPVDMLTYGKVSDGADTLARAGVKDAISATTTANSPVEAAQKQAFKDVGFVANADDLKEMEEKGMANINPQSHAVAKSNGAVALTASLQEDDFGYDLFNVATKAESSSSYDNSTSIKEGTSASAGSMAKLLSTRDGEIALEEGDIIADQALSGDLPTEMSVVNGLSESVMGRVTASDSDSSTKSLSAGVGGKIPLTGLIKGGLGVVKGVADKFGGGPIKRQDGIGGTRTSPGKNDAMFDKALDIVDKYVPSVNVSGSADWSGANRDSDSREIETKAFFGYVMQEYQEQYKSAQTDAEKESIRDEWAVVNEILIDSINAYAMNMAEENIEDLNKDGSFFGDSVTDQMEDLQSMREQVIRR